MSTFDPTGERKFINTSQPTKQQGLSDMLRAKLTQQAAERQQALDLQQYFNAIIKATPSDEKRDNKVDASSYAVGAGRVGKKDDAGKLDYTLLPFKALEDVVAVLGFGAVKYGRTNWQQVERQRYVAAAFRHLVEIAKGEVLDTESGRPHSAHLSCCALFIGEMDRAVK